MTSTGLPAEAPPPTTTLRNSFDAARLVRICLLVLWGIFAGFPVYWMAITAFKNQRDIYQGPYFFPFVDFTPTGRAWEFMMGTARDDVLRGLKNSLLLAGVSSFIAVVLGAFAAYGLARYKYKYGPYRNNDLAFLIVSQRIMPPIVAVIALFAMFKAVSLIDTTVGMIIAYTWFNLPLTVFLLTDFMNRIPIEIEQAAAIDGYGKVAQIWKVVLPVGDAWNGGRLPPFILLCLERLPPGPHVDVPRVSYAAHCHHEHERSNGTQMVAHFGGRVSCDCSSDGSRRNTRPFR